MFISIDEENYARIDYAVGDIVFHKLNKKRYVVAKIYRKLNKALVEDADGNTFEFAATSLVYDQKENSHV